MNYYSIQVLKSQFLNKFNMWAYGTVLESIIDIHDFEKKSSRHYPDFINKLVQRLPGLKKHRCDADYEGRFIERLHEGTWMGHILEHVTIELQILAGISRAFGQTRETSEKGIYFVVFSSPHEKIAKEALAGAIQLIMAVFNDETICLETLIQKIKNCVSKFSIGPSTSILTEAAKKAKIPILQMEPPYQWFQLNHGKFAKSFWTTVTDKTNYLGLSISQNKVLTKNLIERFGIPVAQGKICHSKEEAITLLSEFKSLTIKPLDSNRSHGITTNINNSDEIENAFLFALEYSDNVLVECFYPGDSYCINIVENQVIGILKAYKTIITGNGQKTIAELIDELNRDPHRGQDDSYIYPIIDKQDEAIQIKLTQHHLNLNSILPAHQKMVLKNNDFIETIDINKFNSSILEQALFCTKIIGLNIGAVDLIIKDPSLPLSEENGVVLEVNAGPGMGRLLDPAIGEPSSNLGEILLKHMDVIEDKNKFMLGHVVSTSFDQNILFDLQQLFEKNQKNTGFITPQGVIYPEHQIIDIKLSFTEKNKLIFTNKDLDSALFFIDDFDLLNEGLIASPHFVIMLSIDLSKISRHPFIKKETLINRLMSTPLDALKSDGIAILNGDDPFIVQLYKNCDAPAIFLSQNAHPKHLYPYLKNGSKILTYQSHELILHDKKNPIKCLNKIIIKPQNVLNFMVCTALNLHFNWEEKLFVEANLIKDLE